MPTKAWVVACHGKGTYQVASLCKSDPQLYYQSPDSGAMSIAPKSHSSPAKQIEVIRF